MQPISQSATLRIDLPKLRSGLSGRPELLEALEQGQKKASAQIGANVAMVWALSMKSLYASADVPVLGTREAAQNGIDSIRSAIAAKIIRKDQAEFSVDWNPSTRTIKWLDTGIGMDLDTIRQRFLVLGESGKRNATDSSVAAGGFGIAKAVILGTSATFKWELHTRDNLVVSDGTNSEIEIFDAPYLQGALISVFGVSTDYDYWWDPANGGRRPLEDRLKELLAANDLPDIILRFNGEEVRPLFSRRGGSRIEVRGSWGEGTTATVKAYKRADRRGAYWIRLGGLFQFKHGSSGDLGVDVIIDLTTTVRPGDRGYPLNAGRDAFQGEARNTFRAIIEEIERENLSVGDKEDDEVFDAEGETDDSLLEDIQALTRTMLEDPELAKVLEQAGMNASSPEAALSRDGLGIRADAGETPTSPTASPSAAISSPDSSLTLPVPDPSRPVLKTDVPDDYVLDLTPSKGRLPWFPAGLQTPTAIRAALERAENESPYEIPQAALDALEAARAGALTVAELRVIAEAMHLAARTVAQYHGETRTRVDVAERKERRANSNPFGRLGALRISRINYDRARARAFKRSPRKWLPALLLWDATLKLMTEAGGILRSIKPGFVLEDGTIGLAQHRPDSAVTVIYIHPDRLMENIEQNRERPMAIAGFLHGVSAHELSHADGRMGSGHDQSFVSAREDLGRRTAHILPQLASLAVRLLKLPEPKDELAARLVRLERQLTQVRESRDTLRAEKMKAVRVLERELATCKAEVQARSSDISAEARAACTGACPPESPAGVPCTVRIPVGTGDDPPASLAAMKLVMAVRGVLLDSPPEGVDAPYIERFFRRYHQHLARVVGARLPRREFA